jgi:TolB-like protein/DNA-binding winged helix-turn-helix (wHTH) protein/Flp pilus assembly protein TadD
VNDEQTSTVAQPPNGYRINDLLIDSRLRQVSRNGVDLGIAGLSFDLLLVLVRAAPNLVSTDALMASVWPGIVVSPETVTQRIKMLRKGLGDNAATPRYIAVLRGHGYRMLAPAAPVHPQAPDDHPVIRAAEPAAPGTSSLDPPPARAASAGRRWRLALIAAALFAGTGGIWWVLQPMKDGRTAVHQRHSSATARSGSIAVMPFTNLTGDVAKEYLSDGMAEELISSLSAVPGLKVSARTSSFAYKGHDIDIRRVAQDLGVAVVLEGSVRSAGERIRVSARLVDASRGFQIWSQTYDRQFSDLFKLQDDLAAETVQALRGYWSTDLPTVGGRSALAPDLQAYQLYLQARAVARGDSPSQHAAYALVSQSLARDPNFANALAYRAFVQTSFVLNGDAPSSTLEAAERDAIRALALRPGVAEAAAALGAIAGMRGNWTEAETRFHAGLLANPRDPWLRVLYAISVLMPTGRLQQALSQVRESYGLAPASGFAVHELALADTLVGSDAEAMKLADLNDKLGGGGPPDWDTVLLYTRAAAGSGRYEDVTDRALRTLPPALRSAAGAEVIRTFYAALADPIKRPMADRALQDFVPTLLAASTDGRTKVFFVNLFAMVDALDSAYALANQLIDRIPDANVRSDWDNLWISEMRSFRKDPRFQDLVTRLKFIPYWQQYGSPDGCELNDGKLMCN